MTIETSRNNPLSQSLSRRTSCGGCVLVGLFSVSLFLSLPAWAQEDAVDVPAVPAPPANPTVAKTEKAEEKKAVTNPVATEKAKEDNAKAEKTTEKDKADAGAKKAVEAEGEKEKEDPQKKKVQNPLNNLIRGIFGGPKPNKPIIPKNPANAKPPGAIKQPANGDEAARDRIDARAPYDPSMAKLLRQAARHIKDARTRDDNEEWKLGMQVLKFVLDPVRKKNGKEQVVENALVRGADGEWTTMREEANRLMGQFPPEILARYREENGGVANQMFKEAKQNGNIDQIVTVATQYFHTPAGTKAANWMGMRHFDHGEFGMAARWFRQLLKHEMDVTTDPSWQLKATVAFHQAGNKSATSELLAKLNGTTLQWGKKNVSPDEFLAGLTSHKGHIPKLDDWPVLLGSASHTGTATGGDPLLLSRWSQPLTNSHKAWEKIDELQDDLVDQGYAPVPAFFPITVNGKAIFRTLRGVRVADVQSGQTLWETRGGITPESLITGLQNQSTVQQETRFFGGPFGGRQMVSNGSMGNVPNERITSLLFRNGTWGGLSSDGEQLFVLEDHAVLIPYGPGDYRAVQGQIQDNLRRDYATNKIVSYNLTTGRPRWEIGGTAMDEPFDRRMAGQYFFGVPVANEGELFAIGERDNEIRLFVLEKETGREKWSQLVAYSDAKIDRDFGRRWWNAQVGVGQGVIVCPTTVGWLIGIDRLNRSVLWAYRYSKTQPDQGSHNPFGSRTNNLVQRSNLNEVWGPSAPVIVGHRVVYTPPEDKVLVCLDLFTGKKLWSKQKEDHVYLAGVFENQAVMVGKSKVAAISMESGSTVWTLSFNQDDGRPSGMGVAVDREYHLPMTSRQLWTVDLRNGKVIKKAELPDGLPLLGNLAMYRGLLLSLGAKGMTAYAQEQAIEKEILARRQKDPNDSWAMLFDANIQVLKENYEPALKLLRNVKWETLDSDLQTRYRDLTVRSLIALIQSDFLQRDAEYTELRGFVQSKDEQLTFRRLTADRLRARGDVQSAFDEYLSLGESDGQLQISRDDDRRVKLSMDRWLRGRFEQLWRGVSGDDRARLDERIASSAEAAQSQGEEASQRFLLLFGFHPQAVQVRRALVEEFALSGDVALAQNQLLKLSRNPDDQVAAIALERLARLFRDHGLSRDANYYYQRLAERFPKTRLTDGKLVTVYLEEMKAAKFFGPVVSEPNSWSDAKIEQTRTGTNYSYYGNQEHDLQYTPYRLPYFQERRLRFFRNHQRLGITKAATDETEWLVPLRRGPSGSQGDLMLSDMSGHVVFVVHYGILHALSPIDKKVLWTKALDPKGTQNVYYSNRQNTPDAMQTLEQLNPTAMLQKVGQQRATLAVVNSNYVCVLGRRMLSVLDTVTGRLLWTKDRLPTQTKIYGTDSFVFLVPSDPSQTIALSAIDGQRVEIPKLGTLFGKTLRVMHEGLVLAESKANNSILGLTRGKTVLRYFDPLEQRDLWKQEYPSKTYLSVMSDDHIVALKPDGHVDLLDMETGKTQTLQGVTEEELRTKTEVRAVSDHDNLYLIINQRRPSNRYGYYSSNDIRTIKVHGLVIAWNRHTGKFLWKQKVKDQQLVLMHFTQSPLLLFNMQQYKQMNNFGYSVMNTMAIDKFTGKVKVDVSVPSNYSNFRVYFLNLGQRSLELRSYQLRLRLTALPPGTAEELAPKNPAPAVAE